MGITKRGFNSLPNTTQQAYGAEYGAHLIEQYKLYVEMADRVSQRRMIANSFFVSVHTALIAAFVVLISSHILSATILGSAPFVAVLLLCFLWWRTIVSYGQLNSAKFSVVHDIEKYLPLSPYEAEWKAVGEGKNPRLYRPVTHIENWIPLCFALLYLLLAVLMYFLPIKSASLVAGSVQ